MVLPTGKLAVALSSSGYPISESDDRLAPLAEKLTLLEAAGRCSRLLSSLFATNDRANLQSHILEATFAYQFELSGKPLDYEVRRRSDNETSVDFHRQLTPIKNLYMEMRLVRQPQALTALFEQQLSRSDYFGTTLGGAEDQAQTIRLQQLILSKALSRDGAPIKFSPGTLGDYNVVEVSELHLGMIDLFDCLLAAYGDPAVPEFARRQLFGLFRHGPSTPTTFKRSLLASRPSVKRYTASYFCGSALRGVPSTSRSTTS